MVVMARHLLPGAMLLLIVCFTAVGCQQQAGTVDDDKLEHVSAAHRPADFADAVAQIGKRNPFDATAAGDSGAGDSGGNGANASGSGASLPLSELSDIVVWLPEIAADSDLKKADWNEVQSMAVELESLIAKPNTDSTASGRYVAIVNRLHELIAPSETWKSPAAASTASSSEAAKASTTDASKASTTDAPSNAPIDAPTDTSPKPPMR